MQAILLAFASVYVDFICMEFAAKLHSPADPAAPTGGRPCAEHRSQGMDFTLEFAIGLAGSGRLSAYPSAGAEKGRE